MLLVQWLHIQACTYLPLPVDAVTAEYKPQFPTALQRLGLKYNAPVFGPVGIVALTRTVSLRAIARQVPYEGSPPFFPLRCQKGESKKTWKFPFFLPVLLRIYSQS